MSEKEIKNLSLKPTLIALNEIGAYFWRLRRGKIWMESSEIPKTLGMEEGDEDLLIEKVMLLAKNIMKKESSAAGKKTIEEAIEEIKKARNEKDWDNLAYLLNHCSSPFKKIVNEKINLLITTEKQAIEGILGKGQLKKILKTLENEKSLLSKSISKLIETAEKKEK